MDGELFEKQYRTKELARIFSTNKSLWRENIKIGEERKQSLIARIHTDYFSVRQNKKVISDSCKNHHVATPCKTFHKSSI